MNSETPAAMVQSLGFNSKQLSKGHGWGLNLNKGRVLIESKESVYRESYSIGVSFGHGRCFLNEHMVFGDKDSESEDDESK
jgi:hypothetical protein